MIYILDTDIITILSRSDTNEARRIDQRIVALAKDNSIVTIVLTYEEQMRGWMSLLASKRSRIGEIEVYRRLLQHINFYRQLTVIGYDSGAAEIYSELRELRLRVGAMDLRIASVALHLSAVVVTRNGRDFGRVPNLIIEDWSID